jgi:small-conductance mechanosensitive channel
VTGRRSITLGKVVMVILILLVAYWITGWMSRLVEPLAVRRLKIEVNQARLIRRWVRVALILALVVFTLTWVKIPLTVFAFAGGALAIGVGFGTQTLLKNFISGIIILFERPFRIGDVLDVDGQQGTVTAIGIRSSVLRLWDHTEMLIPNSALLERSLTNWTLSNRMVRFNISVGVAYGSETRRVLAILTEVADRHGLVEKEPKPMALLTRFEESALGFELRFWVNVVLNNPAIISSDLRQMIAAAFAEQGIVIAFPQRDIHFHSFAGSAGTSAFAPEQHEQPTEI